MPSGWVLVDLLIRKIKLRCIKSAVVGMVYYLCEMVRIQIRIKQLDPDLYHIEKQDPDTDPYQSESRIGFGSVLKGSGYATLVVDPKCSNKC